MSSTYIPDGVYVGFRGSIFPSDPISHTFIAVVENGQESDFETGLDALGFNSDQTSIYGDKISLASQGLVHVPPPNGESGAQFEDSVIGAAGDYNSNPETALPKYGLSPFSANCQTWASGLLKAVGVSQGEIAQIWMSDNALDPEVIVPYDVRPQILSGALAAAAPGKSAQLPFGVGPYSGVYAGSAATVTTHGADAAPQNSLTSTPIYAYDGSLIFKAYVSSGPATLFFDDGTRVGLQAGVPLVVSAQQLAEHGAVSVRPDDPSGGDALSSDTTDLQPVSDSPLSDPFALTGARIGEGVSGALQLGNGFGGALGGVASIANAALDPLSPAGRDAGDSALGIGALNEIAGGVHIGGITGAIDVAQGAATGATLIAKGSATAAGQAANFIGGQLGMVGEIFGGAQAGGVTGDLNAAQGLTRLGADFAPTGTAAAAGLASAASGFGAVAGLYEGFKTGGVVGGAEAGIGAATALELAGAATGIGLPVAAGVALLAAVFGGHRDNPANMPDKYDTARYGQEVADLHGTNGANGQNFVEDAQLKTVLGGRTGIAAIEETLAQYGSASNAPSWLAGMFDKLKGMFGVSATGSGTLNFEHVIKNEWVSGAQGTSGQHYAYTDLAQALYDFANAEVKAGAAPVPAANVPAASTVPVPVPAEVHAMPVARRAADAPNTTATVSPVGSQRTATLDVLASRYASALEPLQRPREVLAL